MAYPAGVWETAVAFGSLSGNPIICPGTGGVAFGQMPVIFNVYAMNHPQDLDNEAPWVAISAFAAAYPCEPSGR